MEHKLIVAEKPSVAKAIATVIAPGCKQRRGYLEGNGYLISWCYGHLAKLADASYYDSGYAKWNTASRRSLDRVSVPMWPFILSDRLLIVALVGRYPTNQLIRRRPIAKR